MSTKTERQYPEYPEGRVLGTLDPDKVEAALSILRGSGYAQDDIQVVTAADVDGVESPFDRKGLRGFMERLLLSMGQDLERLEHLRQSVADGRTIITVPVEEEGDAKRQVARILRSHGASGVHYAGRWTIDSLA